MNTLESDPKKTLAPCTTKGVIEKPFTITITMERKLPAVSPTHAPLVKESELQPTPKDYVRALDRAFVLYPTYTEQFWWATCFMREKIFGLGKGALCVQYPSYGSITDKTFHRFIPPVSDPKTVCAQCGQTVVESRSAPGKYECARVHGVEIEWYPKHEFRKLLRTPADTQGISQEALDRVLTAIETCDVYQQQYVMVMIAAEGQVVHVVKGRKTVRDDYGLHAAFARFIYRCKACDKSLLMDRDPTHQCSKCRLYHFCSVECLHRAKAHLESCTGARKQLDELATTFRRTYRRDDDLKELIARHGEKFSAGWSTEGVDKKATAEAAADTGDWTLGVGLEQMPSIVSPEDQRHIEAYMRAMSLDDKRPSASARARASTSASASANAKSGRRSHRPRKIGCHSCRQARKAKQCNGKRYVLHRRPHVYYVHVQTVSALCGSGPSRGVCRSTIQSSQGRQGASHGHRRGRTTQQRVVRSRQHSRRGDDARTRIPSAFLLDPFL